MTAPENERLAKVESKVDDIKEDIIDIKNDIKSILTNQGSYVTKTTARWVIGLMVTAMATYVGIHGL